MNCPHCQQPLVSIPTPQQPLIDVCPKGHGLWLDVAEINLFIDDYQRLLGELRPVSDGGASTTPPIACLRCAGTLTAEGTGEIDVLSCASCRGAWWPKGELSLAHQRYRGAAVLMELDEHGFYRRAAERARRAAEPQADSGGAGSLLVGLLVVGLLGLGGLVVLSHETVQRLTVLSWIAPPDGLFGYLLLGVPGGVGLFAYGFVLTRRAHLIESLPTSAIRSLAVGPVEVAGRARPGGTLQIAPFTGTPCVFYSWKVEERRRSGRYTRWVTVAQGHSEPPFFVEDATGRVMVVPLGADLLLTDRRVFLSHWWRGLPSAVSEGLARLGVRGSARAGRLRCTEWVIRAGRSLYLLGAAHARPVAETVFDNAARLYIGSGPDTDFLIADRSESELLQRLRWQRWAALLAGPALSLACLMALGKFYLRF